MEDKHTPIDETGYIGDIDLSIEKEKKPVFPIIAFVLTVLLTILCVAAEVFTVIIGIDSIDLVFHPTNDGQGLGLIVLIPVFLIASGIILLVSIVTFIFALLSIIIFKRKFKTFRSTAFNIISILSIIMLALFNIANISMFVAIVLHQA